jgi:hypothetical protein
MHIRLTPEEMSMLTADSITDDQIRDLETELLAANGETYEVCSVALKAPLGSLRRAQARARCAELINVRNGR